MSERALGLLREKLECLLEARAITTDPERRFELDKLIERTRTEIGAHDAPGPGPSSAPRGGRSRGSHSRHAASRGGWLALALVLLGAGLALWSVQRVDRPQRVKWGPDDGKPRGLQIVEPTAGFVPWAQLEREIQTRILNRALWIPRDSRVVVLPGPSGHPDMIVEIVDPTGQAIGHIWFGGDPLKEFAWDGLIRVGPLKRSFIATHPESMVTLQRHTSGAYYVVQPHANAR